VGNRSCRALASEDQEISSSRILEALLSTSIIIASSSSIATTIDWCSCRRSISRSCSPLLFREDPNLASSAIQQALRSDDDRNRIIVSDTLNNRVQVLSLIDGSFLFEFGSYGNQPCQFNYPQGVCIANQGRIIVADVSNHRLQAFTHEGHHISSLNCDIWEPPQHIAFDEHRGLIAFSAGNRVHVIGADQWLADTFTWRPDRHRYAPSWMKQAISTMTMIRSVVDECSAISMIPNELLYEIFSFLEGPDRTAPCNRSRTTTTKNKKKCIMM